MLSKPHFENRNESRQRVHLEVLSVKSSSRALHPVSLWSGSVCACALGEGAPARCISLPSLSLSLCWMHSNSDEEQVDAALVSTTSPCADMMRSSNPRSQLHCKHIQTQRGAGDGETVLQLLGLYQSAHACFHVLNSRVFQVSWDMWWHRGLPFKWSSLKLAESSSWRWSDTPGSMWYPP